ncbi:LytR/AlgR family response regulator transcription factor [Flagellimonas aequoris]|uniref:DNA-binding response regulator n=1 Tax=Flagellimonas aequoris TaxID=2306997 RepID=A0A418N2W9_9FLAO|nr:LytTR family DNA-binding domain-containing protein [Allomuricauda aequoris]RIV67612.1 DNA-binding response regulator [Allomuricauda aequoris]TXJ99436.1 response regulator transcription factor [Allomuricauda aequoris]
MDILIIEDEPATAKDLEETIHNLNMDLKVLDIVDSISEGTEWFRKNGQPDLILSDIQLADGLSFELLKKVDVSCPVIFCTAYDEYAIRAFAANGIDYLLKPINEDKLSKSLKRYQLLNDHFARNNPHLQQLLQKVQGQLQTYRSNFLISFQDKMIPIGVVDIAFFYTENGITKLYTMSGKSYTLPYTLEQLEQLLDPKMFFRANRQYIISYSAISSVESYVSRKMCVNMLVDVPTPLLVSKKRSPVFLGWLKER